MNKVTKKELKQIFQQASLKPQNVYVLYFYYLDNIRNLRLSEKEYEKAEKTLREIMGIKHIPAWRL